MEQLYIFGDYLEVNTPLGRMYFVKVCDYSKLMSFVPILYFEKSDLLALINPNYINKFNELSLVQLIFAFKEINQFKPIYQRFKDLFQFIFQDDVFDNIKTDEELNLYRDLIIEMNCIKHEKPNPNPEIEYYNKLERIRKERSGEMITLKAMITSVWLYTNPFELTIYQLYALFERITADKAYNTTTLFRTVTDKVDVVPWYKDDIKSDLKLSDEDKEFANSHLSMIPNK